MKTASPRRRPRSAMGRTLGWLAVVASLALALLGPGTTAVFATGPGNNGMDPTGNGTTSNATVGSSLSAAGDSALMDGSQGGSSLVCDGTTASSASGSFTLSKTLDVGSKITVYLAPNNGSNANPLANVSKNETIVTLGSGDNASGSLIPWTITVTSPFTVTSGGILGVFAVNADYTGTLGSGTVISSSKTFSLNCTEATPTPTPTPTPTLELDTINNDR